MPFVVIQAYVLSAMPATIVPSVVVRDPIVCPTGSPSPTTAPLCPIVECVNAASTLDRDGNGLMGDFYFSVRWVTWDWVTNVLRKSS